MAGWLERRSAAVTDDAGAVLRAWRESAGRTQVEVAEMLGLKQQHLSQMEHGHRPVSLEQRRLIVTELGIVAEDLGLSSGHTRGLVSRDDANPEIAASRLRWRAERRWLNHHRSELARLAVQLYPAEQRVTRTPLIAAPDWQPAEPIELRSLTLELDETPQTAAVEGSEPESEPTRPLRTAGAHFERYTSAIKHLGPPALFESRPSYRLLNASLGAGQLGFGLAAYFDKLDVAETLGHELAAACMNYGVPASRRPGVPASPSALAGWLPFRDLVADPFDPARRAIIPAITTLTIRLRRYPAEPTFLLHWRDPAKVATAGGIYDVIPAGEFQPSSVALWDRRNDFDLWRNIVREFAEELLGEPEHDGTRSQPIAYDDWTLFQRLGQAHADGAVTSFVLGLGLDALTLAATILTVVVIDEDVFTDAFGEMVQFNDEGEVVAVGGGTPAEGLPFTVALPDPPQVRHARSGKRRTCHSWCAHSASSPTASTACETHVRRRHSGLPRARARRDEAARSRPGRVASVGGVLSAVAGRYRCPRLTRSTRACRRWPGGMPATTNGAGPSRRDWPRATARPRSSTSGTPTPAAASSGPATRRSAAATSSPRDRQSPRQFLPGRAGPRQRRRGSVAGHDARAVAAAVPAGARARRSARRPPRRQPGTRRATRPPLGRARRARRHRRRSRRPAADYRRRVRRAGRSRRPHRPYGEAGARHRVGRIRGGIDVSDGLLDHGGPAAASDLHQALAGE